MELSVLVLIFIGLIALYGGGELLVRAAVVIGTWLGLSTLVTGLTIVALGTSAPELAVSIDAAIFGSTEIAISNVIGSNFANIALVLALSALFAPIAVETLVLSRDLPFMLVGFVVTLLILLDNRVGLLDGLILLLGLVIYLGYVIWHTRRHRIKESIDGRQTRSVVKTLLQLAGGISLLALGGHWLVEGAVNIAQKLGVSEAVIGMTIVAVGTSLPEITASLISIARGHGSMAIGNVVGSNIWNTYGVLGATATIIPLQRGQVTYTMVVAMIGAGFLLWVFCRTRFQITRTEGGLLLAAYIACQSYLFI
ncbi:MAG: calcium/sodium antiporter [bacterium]